MIGNVLFDVDNCREDAQNCPAGQTCMTCTGTAQAFLKGDASDEEVGAEITNYLQSPTFLTDSGLESIASSFAASEAYNLEDVPDVATMSDAGSRGDPHCKYF